MHYILNKGRRVTKKDQQSKRKKENYAKTLKRKTKFNSSLSDLPFFYPNTKSNLSRYRWLNAQKDEEGIENRSHSIVFIAGLYQEIGYPSGGGGNHVLGIWHTPVESRPRISAAEPSPC